MADIETLLEMMRALRSPQGGCPWDRAQTFETIVPHTLEEAYEVAEVIEHGALADLRAELGDLLFQVIFYCQLAAEQGLFAFDDVTASLAAKLRERHPHVFADATVADADAQSRRWEAFKARKRRARAGGGRASELDDVPAALPALTRACKLQRRAARVGFDWHDAEAVGGKVGEELEELMHAVAGGCVRELDEEMGDLLFACVNLCRHLEIDPEGALRRANRKFEGRFRFVERRLCELGLEPGDADLEQMDQLWNEAKSTGL